ncbi:hypothetical protein [Adlercreutzia muris]|uniref:Uncharacterized protein n=1 Tax=Adlercreutzia muris TaxID=1796610 RepID=A0A7C8FLE4_9ACTN|nr:hypothetical protein [Adlercreutzia muris]KAB1647998.1 hypothetical protein F8D48_06815 [Adlercreutzia muris]MCR2027708.1 hypothetical protein [Adlercreutzia muris]
MEDVFYVAMLDGVADIIDSPSKIEAYEGRFPIARSGINGYDLVCTPEDGWLIERPSDDELCGIERFRMPVAAPDAVARIMALSIDDPDAARAEIESIGVE